MLQRFGLAEHGTTVRREVGAGVTTFMTMAYVLCVQPAVLATTGMDAGAVLLASCLSAALATFLMGWWANYPVALAPAMGHNFFFAYTVCAVGAMGYGWQAALGANLVAGVAFLIVTVLGLQGRLVAAIPASLRHGIAVGIGLYITLIGLEWAGLVVDHPVTLVTLGDLGSRPVLVALAVLTVTCGLVALRVPGAILLGILFGVVLAIPLGVARYHGVVSAPPSISPTLFRLELEPLLAWSDLWVAVFIFFMLDLFDTMGTLVGVATQGGFMKRGRLPRAKQAFLSDAVGTVGGSCLGTTTVTSYIESAAGIAAGGRTGLTAMTTAGLFVLAIFLYPLVRTVGEGFQIVKTAVEGGAAVQTVTLYPLTAPALIVVGSMMLKSTTKIEWDEPVEALPAFLAMLMIPLSYSISDGIAFGFIACSFLVVLTGRLRRADPLLHVISLLFLVKWIFF